MTTAGCLTRGAGRFLARGCPTCPFVERPDLGFDDRPAIRLPGFSGPKTPKHSGAQGVQARDPPGPKPSGFIRLRLHLPSGPKGFRVANLQPDGDAGPKGDWGRRGSVSKGFASEELRGQRGKGPEDSGAEG